MTQENINNKNEINTLEKRVLEEQQGLIKEGIKEGFLIPFRRNSLHTKEQQLNNFYEAFNKIEFPNQSDIFTKEVIANDSYNTGKVIGYTSFLITVLMPSCYAISKIIDYFQ